MPLDDSQDPMPLDTVEVSDPVVIAVPPVPDDRVSREITKEPYSEGGLSGEAANPEPFRLRQRTDEEIVDYDKGCEVGRKGGQIDDAKSQA